MGRKVYIYELAVKGEEGSTFYVGVTIDKKQRMKAHLTEHNRESYKGKLTWKHLKIRKLLSEGKEIEMLTVAEFNSHEEAYEQEQKYIEDAKNRGCLLVNTATGGMGGGILDKPRRFSEEGAKALVDNAHKVFKDPEVAKKSRENRMKAIRQKSIEASTYKHPITVLDMRTREEVTFKNVYEARDYFYRPHSPIGNVHRSLKKSAKLPSIYKKRYLVFEEGSLTEEQTLKYDIRRYVISKGGELIVYDPKHYRVRRKEPTNKVKDMSYDSYKYLIKDNPNIIHAYE